jgi:peptidoglycan L-alanyl-D-glutamate endopeptidase CwlK
VAILIGVFCYFLLVSAALAIVFLPSARSWTFGRLRRAVVTGRSAAEMAALRRQQGLARATSLLSGAGAGSSQWVALNRRWIALALLVLLTPPMLALALRGWQQVSAYDHTASHEVNEQIATLLRGEQLVPPPPLPPELFGTRELEEARPLVRYASRQWELLNDDFRQRLLVAFKLMRERYGYEMVLLEGYRSPERQAQLAALGSQVTRAGAFESYHQYGLAADSAFRRDGRVVIRETDPWAMRGYELYGEVARSLGLIWGGGWSLKDFGHVELRVPGTLRRRSPNASPASVQEQ